MSTRRRTYTPGTTSSLDDIWDPIVDADENSVKERIARRRRHKQSVRRARQARRAVQAVLVVLAVMVGVWLYGAVISHGFFAVNHVAVSGASTVDEIAVREQVAPHIEDETVLSADLDAIRLAVEELAFVRSVRVERHLPQGISISIAEYEPLAFAVISGQGWLIANDGRILDTAELGSWQDRVPVLVISRRSVAVGDSITDEPAVRVLRALPPTFPGSVATVAVTDGGLVMELRSGLEIRLGQDRQLESKLAVAQRIMEVLPPNRLANLTYMDVSVPARPAVL